MADHLVERYRARRDAGCPIQYEETLDLPAGVRIWQTNLAPVFDAEGRPVKLLGTSRDMTEYRTLQEELAQTSKLATLGTMAAGIAHEMSQPLNIIKITADDCGLMIAGRRDRCPLSGARHGTDRDWPPDGRDRQSDAVLQPA